MHQSHHETTRFCMEIVLQKKTLCNRPDEESTVFLRKYYRKHQPESSCHETTDLWESQGLAPRSSSIPSVVTSIALSQWLKVEVKRSQD